MHEKSKRATFENLLSPHVDELYGAAMRLTRSPADADDVLQETMTRAWAFWDRFEEGTNVRAWMHRILFNTFVNGYRRSRRECEILGRMQRELAGPPHALPPGAESREQTVGDEVSVALETLPASFREVVELVDLGGASYKDAARRIGCPVGTVMSRLHRGRRLLREQLRGYATAEGYVLAA